MEQTALMDRIVRALYGPTYQASKGELADELGVARRVVQRVVGGERALPVGVLAQVRAKLVELKPDLLQQVHEIEALLPELDALIAAGQGTEEG